MNKLENKHLVAKYDWIDLMRAIAILMVIAVHTSHGLKNSDSIIKSALALGGFGVQLFFVASALTLSMSMQRNLQSNSFLFCYCIRRFFRIAPLYYIGIVIYLIWSIAKNYVHTGVAAPLPQYTAPNILANLFFVNGFVPSANNNIVPGGWSIGTEVAFYTIFPAIFLTYNRIKNSPIAVLLITGLLIFSDYYIIKAIEKNLGTSIQTNEFLYFNIASQIQVFLIGMAAYFCIDYTKRVAPFILVPVFILTLPAGILLFQSNKFLALTTISLAFAILASIFSRFNRISPFLKSVGQRSFSMYITHFIIMNIIDHGFNNVINLFGNHPNIKSIAHFTIAVAITYVISGYTKRFIEDPFISMGNRIILKRKNTEVKEFYEA